ncbi:MAG: DNA topoisomerase VI [Candidatus Aenigmatarchaeota archaeon]|nr:DNA topoisomerase IV subunit A [Candidatus Aenigmarchaeota archaeon]RLJ03436.1 MAG: DNA topoisomerase VI [Candidatus Aenigmarchaeota archaeon]
MTKKATVEELKTIGKSVLTDIKNVDIPKLVIPMRSTSNLVFDKNNSCYVLGNKTLIRSGGNIRHIKKLAQFLKVAAFCKDLVKGEKRHVTKRELYYISESWGPNLKFNEQPESDDIIEDIEASLSKPSEDIKIIPNPKGAIYGNITLRFKNPKGETMVINCLNTADGQQIGPRTAEAEFVKTDADKVIAIETGGMYNRLIEENAHEKFNAILINLGGQASRSTRRIIKRLNEELKLPVYLFVDSDPFGMHIAMVIKSGSAKSAHINKRLATPPAQWLGVTASDIIQYKLKTDKMRDLDIKRIKELQNDPRYKNNKRLQKELTIWLKLGKKAEQQALLKYGFKFVVEKYLPEKFRELKAPGFR